MGDQTRNLNPHKAAVVAMHRWGDRYARQGGGSMDFWDGLSESDKQLCRETVTAVMLAPHELPEDHADFMALQRRGLKAIGKAMDKRRKRGPR